MRLICILTLVFTVQLSASVWSQNTAMNISLKNSTLQELFTQIEKNSTYRFFYNNDEIDVNQHISIDVTEKTVGKILSIALEGTPYSFREMDNKLILIERTGVPSSVPGSNHQQKSVSGKVTDTTGAGLPGVSVVVKGTTNGTITDLNGNYSINNLPTNALLQFSFVGMKSQEVAVGNKTTINVTLADETVGIEEVVAIGYGTVKKSNLTSAIAKIDNKNIEIRPITNVGEAMAGQLSGVRAQNTSGIPGAEMNIKIRGVNTINGNSNPLYVIDGVPRDNMTDINPSDVASIQVLKDASATSIYGSRGANGVILIETKKGTGNTSITVDAFYGIQDPVKMMDNMNGNEWAAYQIYARNEAYIRSGGSMKDPMSKRPTNLQIPASWTDGSRPSVDWQKAITQTAPIQNYQVSASSKSDKGSIYVSGGIMNQDGIIKETYYNRLNFRVNAIMNVGEKMKLGLNIAPSYSTQADQNTQGKETTIHQAIMQPPLIQLNEATVTLGYPTADFASIYPNSLEKLKAMTDRTEKGKLTSSIYGEYEIIKGMTFKSQYSYDYRTEIYEYFYPDYIERSSIPTGNSYTSRWNDWTWQNTMNYDFKIAKEHAINLLLGQSVDEHIYFNISAAATGFPNNLVRTLNVATTPTQAYTAKDKSTTTSFFARASYNYKERYLLNASLRKDGSSRFGGNNKWGTFPAISAAWKLNEESFMKDFTWLSLLKVRASWGMAGNDRIGNYDYMSLIKVDNTSFNNAIQVGLAPNNIGNDNLKWETTTTRDFGLDLSILKNRIQFNFDYYNNKTTDLLFNAPVPTATGFSSLRTNLGEIQNKGWEVDINTVNTTGEFRWTSSLNLSRNRNKVIDMGGTQQFTSGNFDGQFITKVGGPVSQFFVYRTDGLLKATDFDASKKALVPIMAGQLPGNMKFVDQNNDGVINSSDIVPYGTNLPDLMYGFTNRFEYKNFELSILLQGQIGGDIMWLGQRQMDAGILNINSLRRWINCWKPDYEAIYGVGENPIPSIAGVDMSWDGKTEYRLAGKNDNNTDLRIYDATFFKIKNISLSYNFPKSILGHSIVKAAKAYISIDNLATFDNYPGVTTESNSFGNETTQAGVDYTTYPLSKRYTLGVNITF